MIISPAFNRFVQPEFLSQSCPYLKLGKYRKVYRFISPDRSVTGMFAYIFGFVSWLAGRFRSRAELELEIIALRHQLAVLSRQRPSRPWLSALARSPALDLLVAVRSLPTLKRTFRVS
jgi:hypothetical protein